MKVHVAPCGIDLIKMTLLHGYIAVAPPLWSEATCPAFSPMLHIILDCTASVKTTPQFKPHSEPLHWGHTISGVHLVRTPGVILIYFQDF